MSTAPVISTAVERARFDDPAFYAQPPSTVHAVFEELRRTEPVFWYEPAKLWVLSKHEDQRYVGSNPEISSSRYGILLGDNFPVEKVIEQLPQYAQDELREGTELSRWERRGIVARAKLSGGDPDNEHMITTDPPRHGELRRIFTKAFSPRLVRRIKPTLEEITDEVLGDIEPGSTDDFAEVVAGLIPSNIMADLCGSTGPTGGGSRPGAKPSWPRLS